jgi:hypothetical protein
MPNLPTGVYPPGPPYSENKSLPCRCFPSPVPLFPVAHPPAAAPARDAEDSEVKPMAASMLLLCLLPLHHLLAGARWPGLTPVRGTTATASSSSGTWCPRSLPSLARSHPGPLAIAVVHFQTSSMRRSPGPMPESRGSCAGVLDYP